MHDVLPINEGSRGIAISGFGQPENLRRSEQAGFVHHVVKSVGPAALDRLICTVQFRVPRSQSA